MIKKSNSVFRHKPRELSSVELDQVGGGQNLAADRVGGKTYTDMDFSQKNFT
jgi:hypothetical protein